MIYSHFLRIKGLSAKTTDSRTQAAVIPRVMGHNLREQVAKMGVRADSHIDATRSKDNIVLRGGCTSDDVASAVNALMKGVIVSKWRTDTIGAIELIFSLPSTAKINHLDYFSASVKWAESFFNVPIVSAVIHLDEDTPHCHVILVPIVNGKLCGSQVMGNKRRMVAMQEDYHSSVGKQYGLARPTPKTRYGAAIKQECTELAFKALEPICGLTDDVLLFFIKGCMDNPEALMQKLGLEMPTSKPKTTFAAIMTKPCKPEKQVRSKYAAKPYPDNYGENSDHSKPEVADTAILNDKEKPIEVESAIPIVVESDLIKPHEKNQPLSCVGVQPHAHLIAHLPDTVPDDYTRIRETDIPANEWDCERGEYTKETPRVSRKEQVFTSVHKALSMRKRN
ncbi:plasmid recombination protein [Undibacterium sp. TC4M20W]|uniref:plasmid recombination protein n=1 Tax=Undibacterium sp. TC4M20W TaxID=3413052 RepID=UPI003BF135B8